VVAIAKVSGFISFIADQKGPRELLGRKASPIRNWNACDVLVTRLVGAPVPERRGQPRGPKFADIEGLSFYTGYLIVCFINEITCEVTMAWGALLPVAFGL
jgi:hypothetical protein